MPQRVRFARIERSAQHARLAHIMQRNSKLARDELSDFAGEDGVSQRYAVINVGGADRADLGRRCQSVEERLGYRLRARGAAAR